MKDEALWKRVLTLIGAFHPAGAVEEQGFNGMRSLPRSEPGHLGLQSMRERAELMDGELEIESSDRGTRVLVRAPLREP